MTQLTYREAAKVTHRSRRTIRRWRLQGMPMTWETRNGQHVRVVERSVLMRWWRGRMRNDPVHQNRLKAARHAEESTTA